MASSFNPYAPPRTAEIREKPTDDESVRREHLGHEASVQSIGRLYFVALALWLIAIPIAIINDPQSAVIPLFVFWLLIAALLGGTAYGLARLKPWGRWVGGVMSLIGVPLSFPVLFVIGPILNFYIIYLLCCRQGRMVFSPEYRRIIEATPHIKYRTSRVVWIFAITLVAAVAVAIIVAIFAMVAARVVG